MLVANEMGKPAKILSMREWIRKTIRSNTWNNLSNLIILGGVYYIFAGNGQTNHLAVTNIVFLFLYIPYITILVPTDAMKSSCNSFFKNKWIVKEGDPVASNVPLKNVWREITLHGLGPGIAAALAGSIVLLWIGNSPWSMCIAVPYAFIVTFLFSNILLKRHLAHHLSALVAEQARSSNERSNTVSFWRHFTGQYVIPWVIIIVYVNFFICFKGNIEVSLLAENMGQIPASRLVVFDVVIWVFVALGWMGLVSMNQGTLDFNLHRVMQERRSFPLARHTRDVILVLVLLFAIPLAAMGITAMILAVAGIMFIPVPVYVLICCAIFASFGILGLYFGMIFGIALDLLDKEKRKNEPGSGEKRL